MMMPKGFNVPIMYVGANKENVKFIQEETFNEVYGNHRLKPCPFCGSLARLEEHVFTGYSNTYGVICPLCRTQGNQFWASKEEAVEMWNRRVEDGKVH